jgi:hypothetical protein
MPRRLCPPLEQNNMKTQRDKNSLINISKDLYYEVSHLIELFLILVKEKSDIKKHAFLESLLIHARNIFYFLYNDENPKYPDDVLSIHFIDSDEWNQFRNYQINLDVFIDFRTRIAKEIAHLTYARLNKTADNINWDISFVYNLRDGIDKFVDLVEDDLLHSEWEKYNLVKEKLSLIEINNPYAQYVYSTH